MTIVTTEKCIIIANLRSNGLTLDQLSFEISDNNNLVVI